MHEHTFPVLPQGYKRYSVEQLLIELAPSLKLRGGRLHALLYMIKQTAPDHWTDPNKEPVYFAPQDQTAAMLNKTRRALYNDEEALEALGLIEKRVKANGARSAWGGAGIVFSKLIELVPHLLDLKEQLNTERTKRKTLRSQRSSLLRHIKRRIEHLPDGLNVESLIEEFNAWPAAGSLASMPIEDLNFHVQNARELCGRFDDLVENSLKTSGEEEEIYPSHIQEYIKDIPVSCNVSVHEMSVDKSTHSFQSTPNGAGNCLEKQDEDDRQHVNRKIQTVLRPDALYRLASSDMRMFIDAAASNASAIREIHIIDAAIELLPHIGINHDAWAKAVTAMGDHGAALCILILDANRTHPTSPVQNCGGALRAMTRRYLAGQLNIVGSLIGLSARKEQRAW